MLPGFDDRAARVQPLTVELSVRPPRIGVFVPEVAGAPWQRCFEAALSHRAGTWGGVGDLIFPLRADLRDHELFWRLADVYDADAFEVDGLVGTDWQDIDRTVWETKLEALRSGFPGMDEAAIIDLVAGDALTDELLPAELNALLVRRLAPLHHGSGSDEPPTGSWGTGHVQELATSDLAVLPVEVRNTRTTLGASQSLLLTAELGRLDHKTVTALADRDISVVEQVVDESSGLAARLYTDSGQQGVRPWTLAQQGLSFYGSSRMMATSPVIVVGDDPWDFVLFYALRRMSTRAWWLPAVVESDPVLWQRFASRMQQFARQSSQLVAVTSYSDPDSAARAVASLGQGNAATKAEPRDWQSVIPGEPNRLYETGNEGHPQAVLLYEGQTPRLPTPLPQHVHHRNEWETSWIVEARTLDWAGLRHPRLAGDLLRHVEGFRQRQSLTGNAYLAPGIFVQGGSPLTSSIVRPTLHPRDLISQAQLICQAVGWTCESSDKGAYAGRAADIFGGLRPLRDALTDPAAQAVLFAYLSGKSQSGAPGRWVASERRRVLTLSDFEGCLGVDAAHGLVDTWRQREALQLGSILKCRRCRQSGWYDIEAFGRSFVCARCRLDQRADTLSWLGLEPRWSYRLDESLIQFLIHHGDLPVIAAATIVEESRLPIDVAFEVELCSPVTQDGEDPERSEHDILMSDGARLWLGEASKAPRLAVAKAAEDARLDRLSAVAGMFDARYVVLANSGDWDERTSNAAKQRFGTVWPQLHFQPDVAMVPRPDVGLNE